MKLLCTVVFPSGLRFALRPRRSGSTLPEPPGHNQSGGCMCEQQQRVTFPSCLLVCTLARPVWKHFAQAFWAIPIRGIHAWHNPKTINCQSVFGLHFDSAGPDCPPTCFPCSMSGRHGVQTVFVWNRSGYKAGGAGPPLVCKPARPTHSAVHHGFQNNMAGRHVAKTNFVQHRSGYEAGCAGPPSLCTSPPSLQVGEHQGFQTACPGGMLSNPVLSRAGRVIKLGVLGQLRFAHIGPPGPDLRMAWFPSNMPGTTAAQTGFVRSRPGYTAGCAWPPSGYTEAVPAQVGERHGSQAAWPGGMLSGPVSFKAAPAIKPAVLGHPRIAHRPYRPRLATNMFPIQHVGEACCPNRFCLEPIWLKGWRCRAAFGLHIGRPAHSDAHHGFQATCPGGMLPKPVLFNTDPAMKLHVPGRLWFAHPPPGPRLANTKGSRQHAREACCPTRCCPQSAGLYSWVCLAAFGLHIGPPGPDWQTTWFPGNMPGRIAAQTGFVQSRPGYTAGCAWSPSGFTSVVPAQVDERHGFQAACLGLTE